MRNDTLVQNLIANFPHFTLPGYVWISFIIWFEAANVSNMLCKQDVSFILGTAD